MIFFLTLADAVSPHGNESVLWGIESQQQTIPRLFAFIWKCLFDFATLTPLLSSARIIESITVYASVQVTVLLL